MPIPGFEFKVTEKKLTCPFNQAHQVTDMQKHLTRCSSYNKDLKVKPCPFNSTHWVKEPEFRHHMDRCPDKAPIDRAVLAMKAGAEGSSGDLSLPVTWGARNEAVQNPVEGWSSEGGADDDWDVEVSQQPRHLRKKYDPLVATQNRDIFRVPTEHRGKSARNDFRRQNTERSQAIQSGSEAVSVAGASSAAAPSVSSIGARRRPTSNPLCCNNMNINPNLGMGRARRTAPAALPAGVVGEPAGGDAAPAARPAVLGRGRGSVTSQLRTPGVRIGADGDKPSSFANSN